MRWTWAVVAFVVVMFVTRVGSAQTPALPLELSWDAPPGCPDAAFVSERVARILRGPPTERTTVIAKGKIDGTSDGRSRLTLTIRTADVEETRSIDAASCSSLAEAAAVVIALAIEPSKDDVVVTPSPPPAPMPAPPRPTVPPPTPPRRRVPARPVPAADSEPPPPRFGVGVGGVLGTGMLPEVGAGVSLSGVVRFDGLRAGGTASLWFPQDASFDRTAGATFQMVDIGISCGYLFRFHRLAFGPTAGMDGTWVRVRGFGIRTPRTSSTLWPTAAFGGRVEARISSRFGLFARGEALLSIDAPRFTLATSSTAVRLHEPGPLGARLSLGVEIVLP